MSKQRYDYEQSYVSNVADDDRTMPAAFETIVDDSGETEPIVEEEGFGETEVIRPEGFKGDRDPVVGWLVCTSGKDFGADFRIHEGWNTIGRNTSNDIVLNDPSVSGEKMATLLYDDPTKSFIIARGNGRNPSRVNGRPLISERELAPFDHVTIGETDLIFVPLCGEAFSWRDKEAGKQA